MFIQTLQIWGKNKDRLQTRRLSWPRPPEVGSKLLWPPSEILWPSGVGTYHRLDSSLLIRLEAPCPVCPVLRKLRGAGVSWDGGTGERIVQTCQWVHWWLSTPSGWSARSRWSWQFPPIAPVSSGLAKKVEPKRFYQSQSPLGLGSDKLRSLCSQIRCP